MPPHSDMYLQLIHRYPPLCHQGPNQNIPSGLQYLPPEASPSRAPWSLWIRSITHRRPAPSCLVVVTGVLAGINTGFYIMFPPPPCSYQEALEIAKKHLNILLTYTGTPGWSRSGPPDAAS